MALDDKIMLTDPVFMVLNTFNFDFLEKIYSNFLDFFSLISPKIYCQATYFQYFKVLNIILLWHLIH